MLKKAICAALGLLVLGVAAYFFIVRPTAKFDGDRVCSTDPASFYLRFSVLNTEDAQTMSFQEGDTLSVSWLIKSGSVDVLIGMAGEAPLYQANGRGNGDEAAFELTVPKTGDYTVTITGRNAKGWLRFEEK